MASAGAAPSIAAAAGAHLQVDRCSPRLSKRTTNITLEQLVHGSNLGQSWPEVGANRPDLDEICQTLNKCVTTFQPTPGPKRPKLVEIWSVLVKFKQNSCTLSRSWTNSCSRWPIWVKFWAINLPKLANVSKNWANIDKIWTKSAKLSPTSTVCRPSWSLWAKCCRNSVEHLVKFGQIPSKFGRVGPTSGQIWQRWLP